MESNASVHSFESCYWPCDERKSSIHDFVSHFGLYQLPRENGSLAASS